MDSNADHRDEDMGAMVLYTPEGNVVAASDFGLSNPPPGFR
jgi:hypothetical protein